jgi:hypothetical protein
MRDTIYRGRRGLAAWASNCRYRHRAWLAQLARAWRYAGGALSAGDAQRMILDCRGPAGWHPLLVLTVEDTLEQAREEFVDHPELPRLVADACFRVGDKWEPHGDELWEARRWAINVAIRYAADEGIALARLDDVREPAS